MIMRQVKIQPKPVKHPAPVDTDRRSPSGKITWKN